MAAEEAGESLSEGARKGVREEADTKMIVESLGPCEVVSVSILDYLDGISCCIHWP